MNAGSRMHNVVDLGLQSGKGVITDSKLWFLQTAFDCSDFWQKLRLIPNLVQIEIKMIEAYPRS